MRCANCGQQNHDMARYCDNCGKESGSRELNLRTFSARECVSCGRMMDLDVYFTMCPHCGFNYRIEISPVKHAPGMTSGMETLLYITSIMIPVAGFIVGATYIRKRDLPSKRLARNCLALAVINTIFSPILIAIGLGQA